MRWLRAPLLLVAASLLAAASPAAAALADQIGATFTLMAEQFVQALDEKRELSPTTKASKHQKIPRGEGEGQSISGDEETESAGAEVVVSQELSGEEVGEATAPPPLTDEEKEEKGEEGGDMGAGWSDQTIESHRKAVQLLIIDETGEERFPRVMERGANSFVEREDASRDGSDASQVCAC